MEKEEVLDLILNKLKLGYYQHGIFHYTLDLTEEEFKKIKEYLQ